MRLGSGYWTFSIDFFNVRFKKIDSASSMIYVIFPE